MFNPNQDRVSYGQELLPPEGFRFVRAVATTYSLDFPTLIAALIPLGLGGEIDDVEMQNPVALLQAIRKVSDKLVIFCEAGRIKAPDAPSRLVTLLDEIIVQVGLPKAGPSYPSFHPKTWTIEYENEAGERRWRFVVLTRNLTSDQSWDVSLTLEGEKRMGAYPKTKQLVGFLKYLQGRVFKGAGADRQKTVVAKLISSLEGVSFSCEKPFDDFDIFPMGLGKYWQAPDPFKADEPFEDRVIVSPFLTPSLMRRLNGPEKERGQKRRVIISRAEAFGKLQQKDASRFEKFIIRQVSAEDASRHDLHAKLYLREYDSRTELWLGSANATDSGTKRNVEMMVALYCANRHLNAEKFLNDLCGGDPRGKGSPLEEVFTVGDSADVESDEEVARNRAETRIKEFCRSRATAVVSEQEGKYDVRVEFPTEFDPSGIFLCPINAPGNMTELCVPRTGFPTTLSLAEVSSLFVVSVPYAAGKDIRRVIKLPTDGIPFERGTAILNEIVKDRPTLLRYLAMLLSPNPLLTLRQIEAYEVGQRDGVKGEAVKPLLPGLYEEMLMTAADDPERIREAGFVMSRLGAGDEFLRGYRNLYRRFAEALKLPTEDVRV